MASNYKIISTLSLKTAKIVKSVGKLLINY